MKIRVKYLFKVVVVLLCIFASKVDSASAQTDPDSGKIVLPFPIEDPLNGDSRKEGNKNLLFKNPKAKLNMILKQGSMYLRLKKALLRIDQLLK